MKNLFTSLRYFLTITLGLIVITCNDAGSGTTPTGNDTQMYDVNVTVSPAGTGSISPSDKGSYEEEKEIELQALPAEGYVFSSWNGEIESTDNPLKFTVDQDYSLNANFKLKSYELTINTEGEGSVSESIVEHKSKEYKHGTVVELEANPAEGYLFIEWIGDIDGTENPSHLTVDEAKEVTAVFKESKTLNLEIYGDNGTVSIEPEGMETTELEQWEYVIGTTVELTASGKGDYVFEEWFGGISSTENPLVITMDQDYYIKVSFNKKSYPLEVSTIGEGSVSKDPDQSEYDSDTNVTLTATPKQGWQFVKWQGDVVSTQNPLQITIDNAKKVTAVFEMLEGLVAYYPFNGNANDVSGNGNTGTVNGAILTTDRYGNTNRAYNFDGINDNILLSNPFFSGNNSLSEITYSYWYNITSLPSASEAYGVMHYDSYWRQKHTKMSDTGSIRYGGANPNPQGYLGVVSDESVNITNSWNHVVITFKASVLSMYLNGNLIKQNTISYSTLNYEKVIAGNSNGKNVIGSSTSVSKGDYDFFKGKLDNISIWNRALTHEEVQYLYNNYEIGID